MANEQNRTEAGGRKPLMNFTKEDKQMSKQPGYDREVVECYVMHLIELKGYDYGFIGGAGFYDSGKVYFFGNIKNHPDYDKIKEFIKYNNSIIEIICQDMPITDIGGAVIIK